jgi:hypothetical protein
MPGETDVFISLPPDTRELEMFGIGTTELLIVLGIVLAIIAAVVIGGINKRR